MIPMLNALREEAKEKTQRLEEKVEKINQEEETLSKTATDIEKELQSEDIKLIKVRIQEFPSLSLFTVAVHIFR